MGSVESDTIIPFNYWDDDDHTRGLSFDITFRFDDVLDSTKLRNALSRLLEIGDWRKVGARLRRNSGTGKLEYHVPAQFDDKRKAFAYSSLALDNTRLAEHSLASHLAQPHQLHAAGRPSFFGIAYTITPEFRSLLRTPDFPDHLDGWLSSDSPQLGIRIVTFQDATLVTVSFLHTFIDMMGLHSIMEAWSAVLRGQEDEVQPFVGFDRDHLAEVNEAKPVEKFVFADKLLIGISWFLFAIRYVLTIELFWRHREEERVIFLPAKYLQGMRDKIMKDLASEQKPGGEIPFVSESDVLFAWWARVVLRAQNPAPNRVINLRNTYDCRDLLATLGHLPSATSAFVCNAVFATVTLLTARQVLEKPLSFTASEIRKSLQQQRNPEQFQALVTLQKTTLDNKHHPALFGNTSMFILMCSNWAKARLFEVDFSAAVKVVGLPLSERCNLLGRPSYVGSSGTKRYATRNTGVVVGKDAAGNWWCLYTLQSRIWPAVEQQLRCMSEEDVS